MLFFVATPTPFDARGRPDLERLRAHVLWLAAQGVEGFVPTAVAGELLYLSDREQEAIHRTVLDAARGLPVYPCVWHPSPHTITYLFEAARENGCSGFLVPPPLHYPLEQPLIAEWYHSVAAAAELPVLAYNDPARFQAAIDEPTYTELRKEGALSGIVDYSGDRWRLQRMAKKDPGAVFASGADLLTDTARMPALAGFVSELGNAWPALCLRAFRGERQLRSALLEREAQIAAAGGFRALKALLDMGCRVPLPRPEPAMLEGLPAAERP